MSAGLLHRMGALKRLLCGGCMDVVHICGIGGMDGISRPSKRPRLLRLASKGMIHKATTAVQYPLCCIQCICVVSSVESVVSIGRKGEVLTRL